MAALLNSVITFPVAESLLQPKRQWQSRFFLSPSTKNFRHSIKSIQAQQSSSDRKIPLEKNYLAIPTLMDVNQICEILPQRFPFLLVDKVIEYNPSVSVVAIKNVTINDYFFVGHFPSKPIMPGVLILEAMAQVGALLLTPTFGGVAILARMDKIVFKKQVFPGDTLVMSIKVVRMQKAFKMARIEGKAYVGGELASQGNFLIAMIPNFN